MSIGGPQVEADAESPPAEAESVISSSVSINSQKYQANGAAKTAVKRPVDLKVRDVKVKRSDSLTKDEKTECNTKARERERLTNNNSSSSSSSSGQRLKRFVQRGDSALKRRHTVGGTRDFDKVRIHWLVGTNGAANSSRHRRRGDNNKDCRQDKEDCDECSAQDNASARWSAWDRLQPLVSDEDLNVDRSLKTWMRSERTRTSSPELCRRTDVVPAVLQLVADDDVVAAANHAADCSLQA